MFTEETKYFNWLKDDLLYLMRWKNVKMFLFWWAIKKEKYWDIDIWIEWEIDERDILTLKSYFKESNFPFYVDIVNFNEVKDNFRNNVKENWVVWIKH